MSRIGEKARKLQSIVELENKFNEIQDSDILLEKILYEARKIVNADAGSIYVVQGNNGQSLQIKYSQNDTLLKKLSHGEKLPYSFFSFPIDETSISGYVASTKKSLNIKDAYKLSDRLPYKFNKSSDITTDYRTKSLYTIPLKMATGTLLGVLQIINAKDKLGNVISFDSDAERYINSLAIPAVRALQHTYSTQNMIKRMLRMSEFRDPKETYPHVERVSTFALEIYDRYAFEKNIPDTERNIFRDNLKIAAKFHDIGKVGISDVILKKTFPRFTEDERNVMKGHTCLGAMLFYPPESFLDKMVIDVALHHHERYDGGESGYPGFFDLENLVTFENEEKDFSDSDAENRFSIGGAVNVLRPLKGEEIPLAARIVAVADVFDALSHKRCYKEAWNVDDAFQEILKESGRQFDPEIVLAFMKIRERILAILAAIPDED